MVESVGTIKVAPSDRPGFVLEMSVTKSEPGPSIQWTAPATATPTILDDILYLTHLGLDNLGTYVANVHTSGAETVEHVYELSSSREAVVVVHGIGEQVELSHATIYADALRRPLDELYERPYILNQVEGVRTRQFRITWRPFRLEPTARGGAIIRTDVFEHYWQHFVRDSRLGQFLGFVRSKLLSDSPLPHRMKTLTVPLLAILFPMLAAASITSVALRSVAIVVLTVVVVQVVLAAMLIPGLWFTVLAGGVLGGLAGMGLVLLIRATDSGPLSSETLVLGLLFTIVLFVAALGLGRPRHRGLVPWGRMDGNRWRTWMAIAAVAPISLIVQQWPNLDFPGSSDPTPSLRVSAWASGVAGLAFVALWARLGRRVWWITVIGAALSVQVAVAISLLPSAGGETGGPNAIAQLVIGLIGAAVLGWIVHHLGDALRYLDTNPDNHDVREKLTRSGEVLLARLHSDEEYGRVVLIGHSMGSMVAYDMLLRYWQGVYEDLPDSPFDLADFETRAVPALYRACLDDGDVLAPKRIDRSDSAPGVPEPTEVVQRFLVGQAEIWNCLSKTSTTAKRWLVSDLVTLACPYTYAHFTYPDLESWFLARRYASIPPITQTALPEMRFLDKGFFRFHQSAMFAPTRWTNFYYENDIVGGPVAPVFGPGARDFVIDEPGLWKTLFPVNHTHYPRDPRVKALMRDILDPQIRGIPVRTEPGMAGLMNSGKSAMIQVLGQYGSGDRSRPGAPPDPGFWLSHDRLLKIRRADPILRRLKPAPSSRTTVQVDDDQTVLIPITYPNIEEQVVGQIDEDHPGGEG